VIGSVRCKNSEGKKNINILGQKSKSFILFNTEKQMYRWWELIIEKNDKLINFEIMMLL